MMVLFRIWLGWDPEWVNEWVRPNILHRKSAFQFPHLWGVAEEKHAKQISAGMQKLPVAVCFKAVARTRGAFCSAHDWVVTTGKRASQLLLRRQRATSEDEWSHVWQSSDMEEGRREGEGCVEMEVRRGDVLAGLFSSSCRVKLKAKHHLFGYKHQTLSSRI